jgi:hypothetical protein
MKNEQSGLSDKTIAVWKKGAKKIGYSVLKPPVCPPITVKPQSSDQIWTNAFAAAGMTNDTLHVRVGEEVWSVNFPKVADDLLVDSKIFKASVVSALDHFQKIFFPITIPVAKAVIMEIDNFIVEDDVYSHYPVVSCKPVFVGRQKDIKEFLEPFDRWSNHQLYWKGSFLKSKTTGKIVGIRLVNLLYNVPDKFHMGQPISYTEKILI